MTLHETWYVYRAIWSVLHESLPSVIPTLQPPTFHRFSYFITHTTRIFFPLAISDTEITVKESMWLILHRTFCFSCFRRWHLRHADSPTWDSPPQWVMHSRPYKISFGLSNDIIHLKSDFSSPKSQLTKLQQSVDIQFRNKDRSTAGSLSPQSVHKSHKDVARTPSPQRGHYTQLTWRTYH
jgi:hypothetical protein